MTAKKKIWMAFTGFFPILATVAVSAMTIMSGGDPPDSVLNLWVLALLTMVAGLVTYLHDGVIKDRIPEKERGGWTVVLIIFTMIAMPVYYWKFIRTSSSET
jgi:hypothetical protein